MQQLFLVITGGKKFHLLSIHLSLFHLHVLTLRALIGSILPHKTHTAEHLGKTAGTEDEHQFALKRLITVHITHRLDIFLLTVLQFRFQDINLCIEHFYLNIQ